MDVWKAEYNRIMKNIKEAKEANQPRRLKIWLTKLERWQIGYGAYGPISGGRNA